MIFRMILSSIVSLIRSDNQGRIRGFSKRGGPGPGVGGRFRERIFLNLQPPLREAVYFLFLFIVGVDFL